MGYRRKGLLKIAAVAALSAGGVMLMAQQETFAKSVKITSNVSVSAANPNDRNVTLTGHNKIYNKAGVLKGAKAVTSTSQLKKLTRSVRSKDTFRVYRMATTNKKQVYYKVVSFESKHRGWIYGGKVKNAYTGGLRQIETTQNIQLSDEVKNTTYHLKTAGTSSDENTWVDVPWTQYKAGLNTKDSTPYANDDLKVTAAKKMTRQYYQTYYYVQNAQHPEFNGWINMNSLKGPDKVVTNTVTVPGPTQTVTKTVEVPGPTKVVTVPAENKLTINYMTNRFDSSAKSDKAAPGNSAQWAEAVPVISKGILQNYQKQFADAINQMKDKKQLTQADLNILGDGQVFSYWDDEWGDYQVSIHVSYDATKNTANINLVWEDSQTFISRDANYYLHVDDNFSPWDLIHDFVYNGHYVDPEQFPDFFTITENTVDTTKAGEYVVKYHMNDYPNQVFTVPVYVTNK